MEPTPDQQKELERLSVETDAPDAGKRFTTLARIMVAVPKEEAEQEETEVKDGKPLKRDFGKTKKES